MIERNLIDVQITKILEDRSLTIAKIEHFTQNGDVIARVADKQGFSYGEIDAVKLYLGVDDNHAVIQTLKDLWV